MYSSPIQKRACPITHIAKRLCMRAQCPVHWRWLLLRGLRRDGGGRQRAGLQPPEPKLVQEVTEEGCGDRWCGYDGHGACCHAAAEGATDGGEPGGDPGGAESRDAERTNYCHGSEGAGDRVCGRPAEAGGSGGALGLWEILVLAQRAVHSGLARLAALLYS